MAKFAFLVVLAKVLAKVLAEQDCHSPGACQDEGSALLQLNHGEKDESMELDGIPFWLKKKIHDALKKEGPAPAPSPSFPCVDAEPQSPRNVSLGFEGKEHPRVKPVGLFDEFPNLIHVNTHFHLGAEHLNVDAGGYSVPVDQALPDYTPEAVVPNDIRPGYFCAPVDETPPMGNLTDYDFQWCKNVKVGYTYEFHWVYSTAGPKTEVLSGGLGGVFARDLNPSVVVRGQVCRIVNYEGQDYKMFNTTWREPVSDSMLYIGSTTGTSYDNTECSPYEVTWHVDRECCILSAQNMDRMCHDLLTFGENMENDVKPAPSRETVAPFISDTNASQVFDYSSSR